MPDAPRKYRPRQRPPAPPRESAHNRLYTYRWRQASKAFLDAHPLCAECGRQGRTESATCVDHIIPHRGDEQLFWKESNWQSLCKPCHDTKTGRGE